MSDTKHILTIIEHICGFDFMLELAIPGPFTCRCGAKGAVVNGTVEWEVENPSAAGRQRGTMTDEHILTLPGVRGFLANFSRHCGTSRSVFEGQFLAAVKEALAESERKAAALDWLEAKLKTVDVVLQEYHGEYSCYCTLVPAPSFDSLLLAIEASMKAEEK